MKASKLRPGAPPLSCRGNPAGEVDQRARHLEGRGRGTRPHDAQLEEGVGMWPGLREGRGLGGPCCQWAPRASCWPTEQFCFLKPAPLPPAAIQPGANPRKGVSTGWGPYRKPKSGRASWFWREAPMATATPRHSLAHQASLPQDPRPHREHTGRGLEALLFCQELEVHVVLSGTL